jgi:xylulokinase
LENLMSFYLAIDIGTTSAKAALYNQQGVLAHTLSTKYEISYPEIGWAEQDPDDWWEATQILSRQLAQIAGKQGIRAVGISGQAPSCVPVNKKGEPIRKAILWLDRRAQPQVEWIKLNLPTGFPEAVSKNKVDSYFGGLKWLWFRQNEPDLYNHTWKFLQANNYIIFQLTGEVAIDPSQASLCSPCFDIEYMQWSEEICSDLDLDNDKLPPIYPSVKIIGEITTRASTQTGIPKGTPVVCGGGDFACSCLGAGVYEPGKAAMMLGTAGNLLVPTQADMDIRLLNTFNVTGDRLSVGGVMAGGAVQWFGEMLNTDQDDLYDILDTEAAQTMPGAGGLIFLPYLMGERTPIWDPLARGVFFGLNASHKRGHLFRAILEGVAYAYRQMMDIFAEVGQPVEEIMAINGGARSCLWRQIFADVLEVPIRWRPTSSGTLLGTAFLTAVGMGDINGFEDLNSWLDTPIDTFPDPTVAVYKKLYPVYSRLYDNLKEDFKSLIVD